MFPSSVSLTALKEITWKHVGEIGQRMEESL
jgi:hypothetical protein